MKKLSKLIAAITLAATLAAPLSAAAADSTTLSIVDPNGDITYFSGQFEGVTGTVPYVLSTTFTFTDYTGKTVTVGEIGGTVTVYQTQSNLYLESEYMGSTRIYPLRLSEQGILSLDTNKQDYLSIGVDENSGIGSGYITSDGCYALVPTSATSLGNDGILFLQVGGTGGTPIENPGEAAGSVAGFTDVTTSDYFADAVQWAVDTGVTSGTSATTFSPDQTCTRAQVVTFLWRMYGQEAVSAENPFQDMSADDYFYQAALWAAEKGITTGTSATTFSPAQTCTRGQVVTFLWRAAGSPQATQPMAFTDVAEGSYCYDAVRWAAEAGVVTGSGTFDPDGAATRAQTVTFLYRA